MERRSPLQAAYENLGAKFVSFQGCHVPEVFTGITDECLAVRQAAGVVDRSGRAFLVATGADHVEFLHRMLSNDVEGLAPGQGNYSTLLTAQAHIIADLYLWRMDDHILLETHWARREKMRETLAHYIIADDVLLEDQSDRLTAIAIEGPQAAALLAAAGAQTLPGKDFNHTWVILTGQTPVHIARVSQTGGEGCQMIFLAEYAQNVWNALTAAGSQVPWKPVGLAALNVLRTEAGIPWYGVDMVETTLPPEAGLETRAISYTKGCYLGQEIIERIRSRGHVNRKLAGLRIESDGIPPAGTSLVAEGKEVGEITTAVHSPTLNCVIALGYLRREQLAPHTRLKLSSGGNAEVTSIPFFGPA